MCLYATSDLAIRGLEYPRWHGVHISPSDQKDVSSQIEIRYRPWACQVTVSSLGGVGHGVTHLSGGSAGFDEDAEYAETWKATGEISLAFRKNVWGKRSLNWPFIVID